MSDPHEGAQPSLRVVGGGDPTDEELAAVVVAVATRGGSASASATPPSRWNDRRAQLRKPLHPGPGGWVAAARR